MHLLRTMTRTIIYSCGIRVQFFGVYTRVRLDLHDLAPIAVIATKINVTRRERHAWSKDGWLESYQSLLKAA